jgi:hypothetical protein
MSTDLVSPANGGIARRQRAHFDHGQVELIRNTVAKDCDAAELGMFLEVCARYELDPFSKQIWAMKIQNKVQIVVSRDGLLALANRHTPFGDLKVSGGGEFLGCQSDVVREHDFFAKTVDREGHIHIEQRYRDEAGEPTHGGPNGDLRGSIIGSWALVRRRDHADTYFFAYWDEYEKTGEPRHNVWKSHPTAMMQKVSETMALRKAFSVSGVVGESEAPPPRDLAAVPADTDFGEDPEVEVRLKELFKLLEYPARKITLKMAGPYGTGLDDAGRKALIEQLVAEAVERGIEVPEPAIEGTVVEEAEVPA